jgi:hypothetical protein
MAQGFIYLTAVLTWFTRHVRAWRVSMALEADFCMDAVEEALACHGTPEIFTPDSHTDAAKIVLTGPLRYEAGGMLERECDDGEDGFFDLSDRYARLGMPIGSRWSRSTHLVPWEEFRPTFERVWHKPEAELHWHNARNLFSSTEVPLS